MLNKKKYSSKHPIFFSGLLLLSALSGGVAVAQDDTASDSTAPEVEMTVENNSEKGVKIQDNAENEAVKEELLDIDFSTEKSEYQVGEHIHFNVKGSKPFYLYLIATDRGTGEQTLLLPNAAQTYNAYPANREFTLPDKTVYFSGKNASDITVSAVATEDYIDMDFASAQQQSKDGFYTDKALIDDLYGQFDALQMHNEDMQSDGMESKDIHSKDVANSRKKIVVDLDLTIVEAEPVATPPVDPEDNPVVFLSSNCAVCAVDKPLDIGFGANKDGAITLLLLEPGGNQTVLLKEEVKAGDIKYISAIAQAPLGPHTLVAVFGQDVNEIPKALSNVMPAADSSDDMKSKGLKLIEQPEALLPHAVRLFSIVE